MSWPWIIGMLKTPWLGIRSLSFKIYIEEDIFCKVLRTEVNPGGRYRIVMTVNNMAKRPGVVDLVASRARMALRNCEYHHQRSIWTPVAWVGNIHYYQDFLLRRFYCLGAF
jgi:hypothetical protein